MDEFVDLANPEMLDFLKACLRGIARTARNRNLEDPRIFLALFVGDRQVVYITNIDPDEAIDLVEGAIATVRAGDGIDLG